MNPQRERYPNNPSLKLKVKVQRITGDDAAATIQIFTNTNEIRQYTRYGQFSFEVDGQPATLTIYETPHGYFLPFADANAGTETYGAGRYLDLESADGETFIVDFNRAYNPMCAYSDLYSCPITPAENRLKVAIRAGEKMPPGH